jgi:hypothetical protein
MANQKVFVSPGVYTSETDLSFVSQSIGVTTLGMVGETIKGPAFEPIFITSYDEFQTFFGGTSPEKYINTQIPKYESAYIAKSYLQQSNQLYVTRVLGLSGYDAGPSWSITTIANVNNSTIGLTGTTGVGPTFSISFTGTSGTTGTFVITSGTYPNGVSLTTFSSDTYTNSTGAVSTFYDDLKTFANNVAGSNTLTGETSTYGSLPVPVYNSITGSTQSGLTSYNYFGTTVALNSNGTPVDENDVWNYATFTNEPNTNNYNGYSFYYNTSAWNQVAGSFTGTVTGNTYVFSGTAYTGYSDMVVATVRSRGITSYTSTNHGQIYSLSANTLTIDGTNSTTMSGDPFGNFVLSGNTTGNSNFTFNVSLKPTNSNYITNVLGTDNFGKDRNDVPIFVEEHYPTLLNQAYKLGYIRGLKTSLTYLPSARTGGSTSIGWYLEKYQSPKTPFVVSELRGNKVYNLFKFISISDGSNANTEAKVSIINMSFKNRTFDVLVRSYYDSDIAPVVLEKYTNCTLDETQNSFIGKKIGTSDGKYNLISKYIMLEMGDEFPSDAIPCGFMGYPHRKYGTKLSPTVLYKTKYYFNNEVVNNEPFAASNAVPADNVKRTYLGFSTSYGYDNSLLGYKGKQKPNSIIADGTEWNVVTKGFHMDSGATVVTIANAYTTSGQTAFEVGTGSFNVEPEDNTNPYYYLYSRKFTLLFEGGFDGWDVYSEKRTNGDSYQIGGTDYMRGALSIPGKYAAATGQGTFKEITEGDGTVDFATTDYYAYYKGILTFQNPESTNINVFVTPGIDYVNNSNLVENAIDMIESDRADSIYIVTTPDANLLTTNVNDVIYPQESIVSLEETNIDSNYTATYYPWILVRDQVNNTQVYIPPTAEVCRNLALTDNVAFPWFASAGYNRGLVNSVKARLKLTQDDRDTLYQGRINPIATFSDVNTVIWGNKTLQVRESALNRINVRRLLLQARKLISAVAVRLLFEQNDQIVRQQFLDTVNPILDGIRRDRGLTDFRVTVSNDPEDIDRNTMSGKIYIKPTRSLEFISLEFVITPTGASFEDV